MILKKFYIKKEKMDIKNVSKYLKENKENVFKLNPNKIIKFYNILYKKEILDEKVVFFAEKIINKTYKGEQISGNFNYIIFKYKDKFEIFDLVTLNEKDIENLKD